MRKLDQFQWTANGTGLVRQAGYDAIRGALTVYLVNGAEYDFLNVPAALAERLANDEYPDDVFRQSILAVYDYRLMSQAHAWRD